MKRVSNLIFLLFICLSTQAVAQHHTFASRSELGVLLGGSYYIGDLNRFGHFKGTQPAGGIIYRYNIHSRLTFRANLMYGNIVGDDAWAKDEAFVNRNLNFRSDIFEFGAGVEFHYMKFQLGHKKYKATGYLLAQLALFKMNPKTMHDGEWVYLRDLGTEGQGSDLSTKKNYSLLHGSIPLGAGFKVTFGKRFALGLEYGIRKTFTDYIDDVKSDTYVDPVLLAAANSPLSAELSNRSLNGDRNGMRGNSATKDWYSFFSMTFTFRLGDPEKCQFKR